MRKLPIVFSLLCIVVLTSCSQEKSARGYDDKAEQARVHKEKCIMSKRSNLNLPECAGEK